MAILTLPLTPISKARAARTLLLFKRRRARRLRHYSYAYVGEYQFSPSGSPLLLPPRPPGLSAWRAATKHRRSGSRAREVLASIFLCGGCGVDAEGIDVAVLDGLPPRPDAPRAAYGDYGQEAYGREEVEEDEEVYGDEYGEEEEVDRRAERFIERFYQEMRMQETRRLLV